MQHEPYRQRLLESVEKLLSIPSADLRVALSHAADVAASALPGTDKVDAFLYDPSRDSLVALGTSDQPLSELQRKHGLDVLPVANGGRAARIFATGEPFLTGRLDRDPEELRGMKEVLQIKSQIGVPLEVNGERRGVLLIASRQPDCWTQDDLRFTESVGHWVGVLAHHAELVQEIAKNSVEQGRRAVAEELVTVLAHDLRNYVHPIRLRLELIKRRAEREGRTVDQQDADLSIRGIVQLNHLISNILDVARIDQGVFQIEPAPVDLVRLLEEIVQPLSTPSHPVHLKVREDVIVIADAARTRQCLENLLANALKHSPEHAAVTVEVYRRRLDTGTFGMVEVLNEGAGVAPEVLPHLFERFVTSGSRSGGLGLGLYLAKRIAVLHGGDLTVESALGQGARFTLMLPIWE